MARTNQVAFFSKLKEIEQEVDQLHNIDTLSEKKIKEAEAMLTTAYQVIDKACKTHLIHKNTASRKKSRIAILIAKVKGIK